MYIYAITYMAMALYTYAHGRSSFARTRPTKPPAYPDRPESFQRNALKNGVLNIFKNIFFFFGNNRPPSRAYTPPRTRLVNRLVIDRIDRIEYFSGNDKENYFFYASLYGRDRSAAASYTHTLYTVIIITTTIFFFYK